MKKAIFVLAVTALLSTAAFAQTVYTSNAPYVCKGEASHYPITSFSQFFCNVVIDYNNGSPAEYQFAGGGRFVMYAPFSMFMCVDPATANLPPAQEKWHLAGLVETGFTLPGSQPGTYAFDWQGYDNSGGTDPYGNHICGAYHYGFASGTWRDSTPNWRGWIYPVLQTHSITVVQ